MKKEYQGKFIVFEGIDGSGKSTQAKLLVKYLRENSYEVEFVYFPQYGNKSAGLVEEYLTGKYGGAREVSPYQASIFYACDRFDASFKIREWLKQGKIIISDRYIGSNVGHQGGKIVDEKKRKDYLEWLYNLEYNIFKIPKPNLSLILRVPLEMAQNLSCNITDREKADKKKIYLGHRRKDIHEGSSNHLKNTEQAYLDAAEIFPKDFKVLECFNKGRLLSPDEIHKEIRKIVVKILK